MKIRKYTIGRSADNDEVISEPDVSAHHAVIFVIGDVVSIDDLNSSNGTYHNGYKIKSTVLKRNSEIKIANKYSVNLLPFFDNYNSDFQVDADNNYVRQFNELETVWIDKEEKRHKLERMDKLRDFSIRTVLFLVPCGLLSLMPKDSEYARYYVPVSLALPILINLMSLGESGLKKKNKKLDIEFKSKYKCPRCGVQLYEDWQILKNQKECFHCKAIWSL